MRSAVRLFCFLTGMVFQQFPPLLLLVSYYLFLLFIGWGESAKIHRLSSGVKARGKLTEITAVCGKCRKSGSKGFLSRSAVGRLDKGAPARVRRFWALLGALPGLRRGMAFPAFGVTEPEAFLARWMGVVHLLAQDEEPAQRPGCPLGWLRGRVLDVGFRFCHGHYSASRIGGIGGADGSRINAPGFSCRWPRSMRYSRPGQASLIFFNSRRQSLRKILDGAVVTRLGRIHTKLPVERRP